MCAKSAGQDGSAASMTYLLMHDREPVAAFRSKRSAMTMRRQLRVARQARIEAEVPSLVGQEYFAYSRSGATARLTRHDEASARRTIGERTPDVVLVEVPTDVVPDFDKLYPPYIAEVTEQAYEPTTAPCPACGKSIEYDAEYKGGDYLTWCDACDWHGFVTEHLLAGDKAGAKLW